MNLTNVIGSSNEAPDVADLCMGSMSDKTRLRWPGIDTPIEASLNVFVAQENDSVSNVV